MTRTFSRSAKTLTAALALTLATSVAVPPTFAATANGPLGVSKQYQSSPDVRQVAGRHWRHRHHRRHRNHRWRHRRHNNNAGAAILGGIIGLGAGLAIGNATRAPRYRGYRGGRYPAWSRAWYNYCENRYRSFNRRTGYFLGYDGQYHFCVAR